MAYNKRNNQDRLPKLEYFQLRLKDAVRDGNQDKANYYRGRIEQLQRDEAQKFIEDDERMSLPVQGMFGSRENLEEAFKYANQIATTLDSPIHAMTAVYVLYNTIAENYDLVPKAK